MGLRDHFGPVGVLHRGLWAISLLAAVVFSDCSRQKDIRIVVNVEKDPVRPALIEVNGEPRGYETAARKQIAMRSQVGDVITVAVTLDSVQYQKLLVTTEDDYSLSFHFGAPTHDGAKKEEVTVKDTNIVTHPEGVAQLTVPGDLRFPVTSLAGKRDTSIAIANSGNSTLRVRGMTLEGTCPHDFRVDAPLKFDVRPGAQTTVLLRFIPLAGGTRTAVLSISSNDGARNPIHIALTGIGQPDTVEQAVASTLEQAARDFGNGQFVRSERICSSILREDQYDADAYYLRARARYELKLFEGAIGDFRVFYAYRTKIRNRDDVNRLTCEALYYKAMAGYHRWQSMASGDESGNARREAAGYWKDFLGLNICHSDQRFVDNAKQTLKQLEESK